MAQKSNFAFVKHASLRGNLDDVFEHILVLIPLASDTQYNAIARSAFRKTIIIHTASIVEGLLFYVLDTNFSESDIAESYSYWKLKDRKDVYIIDNKQKIVAGRFEYVPGDGRKDKLNLGMINKFLYEHDVITQALLEKVDKVRMFRNHQHIGTRKKVRVYTKKDMENIFSITKDVKRFVRQRVS